MALLLAVLDRRGHGAEEVRAALGIDPIGDALRGRTIEPDAAVGSAARLARHVARRRPGLSTLVADGRPWHAAGASEAQELAYTLAAAVHYLRALEAAGLEVGPAAGQVAFALAADADLFLTVAKLRALRLLWRRVLEARAPPRRPRRCACTPRPRRACTPAAIRGLTCCAAPSPASPPRGRRRQRHRPAPRPRARPALPALAPPRPQHRPRPDGGEQPAPGRPTRPAAAGTSRA
jgi:hypothetical protein